jgi:hypothetical protein
MKSQGVCFPPIADIGASPDASRLSVTRSVRLSSLGEEVIAMKTVKVTFPDGSVRDCPARERLLESKEIPPGPPQSYLEPIPTPEWRFNAVIGGWVASARV